MKENAELSDEYAERNSVPLYERAIELRMPYLNDLIRGRKTDDDRHDFVGILTIAKRLRRVEQEAAHDNPFADQLLLNIDVRMSKALEFIREKQAYIDTVLSQEIDSERLHQLRGIAFDSCTDVSFRSISLGLLCDWLLDIDQLLVDYDIAWRELAMRKREYSDVRIEVCRRFRGTLDEILKGGLGHVNRYDVKVRKKAPKNNKIDLTEDVLLRKTRASFAPNIFYAATHRDKEDRHKMYQIK